MPELSAKSVAVCRALAQAAGGALVVVGLAVLAGWNFNLPVMTSLVPGWAAMKPNTALAFMLAGVALQGLVAQERLRNSRRMWWVLAAAGGVTLIGAMALTHHTLGLNLGLNRLLFHGAHQSDPAWPGQMSQLAATDFLLLGIVLLLLSGKRHPVSIWGAQLAALTAAFGAFIALTGYLYGREALGLAPFFTSTALHTAIALLGLSVGVVCVQPEAGLMALFNARSAGGAVLRRLLLPIVLLPVVLNWLELEGERRGIFPAGFGWMVDAALTVLLVGALVWVVARIVHQKDIAREAAETELRQSEERYRQLVEMSPVAIIVKDQRRIEFVNSAARALVGAANDDEMLGKSPFAFLHPESRGSFEKDFCRVLRDGTPVPPTEQRVVRLDGTECDIEFSATAVDYHGQRFAQVVAKDITTRKQSEQALRESEERFRLIAETVTEVFWMADVKLERMVYVSPAYERIWGRTCESLYERPRSFLEAVHPDDRDRVLIDLEAQRQGQPFAHEYRVVRPDGTVRWVLDRGYPVTDGGDEVIHYAGVAQDITDRKQAEEALRSSVERLHLLARITGDAIWDWDMVTDSTWWSEAFVDKFGYPRNTVPSFSGWLDHVHPEDRDRATAEFNDALAKKATAWTSEYRFRRADGSYGIVFDRIFGLCDASGRLVRMLGSMVDITEMRRAEERARLLAQAVESSSDLISITSLDDRFVFANRAFLEAYGYSAEEVLGHSPSMLAPPSEDFLATVRPSALAGGWSGELVNRRKDGSQFSLYLNASPVRDAHGQVVALIGVGKDISERKRRDEQIRFQAWLLDQVKNAVIATDAQGRITYWNNHAVTLYQWTAAEAVGKFLMELLIPLPERTRATAIVEKLRDVDTWEGEFVVQRKDGHLLTVYVADALLRDGEGKVSGVVGISFDITELKRAEEMRHRDAHVLAQLHDAVICTDLAGKIVYWNIAAARLLGWTADEVIGRSFLEQYPEPERAAVWEGFQRVRGGGPVEGERRRWRRDGTSIWIDSHVSLHCQADGQPSGVISVARDITSRKQAEAILHASEARFRATFEQAAMGILLTTLEGRYLSVNQKFCAITGYTAEELLVRSSRDITHPDDLESETTHVQRLLSGVTTSASLEKRYLRKDGSTVWVERTASIVRRADESPDYFIVLVEDITQRRNLETQLLHAQKMEAVGQLAGGVAHDFNNMLTAIQGHTSLLNMTATLPASARESLDEIMLAAQRAGSLTRQLLLFSRREVMQPTTLNLNDTITGIAKMLQRLIGENVRMRLQLCPHPLPVYADAGMVDQVLMNLAVNARDAMPRGGELVIEASRAEIDAATARQNPEAATGPYACLKVGDTGTGIPPEVLPRIFEPFFTTKEVGKGTGLGLATVFGIVRQHRGWIKVNSEVDRGTSFRIHLPLVGSSELSADVEETPSPPLHGRGETVLLVEDDAAVRKMTARILEQAGYHVRSAPTGDDALREWVTHTGHVDLLITDLVMPGRLNGRELAAELRTRQRGLAVIFVSGYSAELAGHELAMGAKQRFLSKPFEVGRLLTTIGELLRPPTPTFD